VERSNETAIVCPRSTPPVALTEQADDNVGAADYRVLMAYSTSTSFTDIRASADRVWAAVTRPELVERWQYGSRLITDWSIGGPIRFVSEWEGRRFEQWGTVLEFEPLHGLKYTLFAPRPDLTDSPENYFTMTYTLTPVGDRTRITIVQVDPRPSVDDGGEFEEDFDEDDDAAEAAAAATTQADENPVLIALKELCEE
jgi:uncharacterized protein YndB with AHSA1/START domain